MISGLSIPSLWLSNISLTRCSVVAYQNVRSQTHRANNHVVEDKLFSVSVSFPWILTSLSSALLQLRYQTQFTLNLQDKKTQKCHFPFFFILDEQIIIRIIRTSWFMQNFSGCVGRCQADCKICPRKIFDIMKIRSLFTRCPFFAKQCICSCEPTNSGSNCKSYFIEIF